MSIPSPGRVEIDEAPAAASHLNFYISNQALIVPAYGALTGKDSRPKRRSKSSNGWSTGRIFMRSISALLTGGGSFHCISQQQPE